MRLDNSISVLKYLIASILVGVILGVGGAFAAQGFRSGIVIISEYAEKVASNFNGLGRAAGRAADFFNQ